MPWQSSPCSARTLACRVETHLDARSLPDAPSVETSLDPLRKSAYITLPYIAAQPLDWPDDAPLPEILSADELQRCQRFRNTRDRARYAQSHVFLRETLSRFADAAPADWQFKHGEHGRPAIAAPAGSNLDFNLSHTRDFAACVVTSGTPCGIDIERIRPVSHLLDIARTRFAPEEFHELASLPEESRPRRFFELWTEKEAWVKACGKGLLMPIDRIVSEIPGITLKRVEPPPDYVIAVVLLKAANDE